MKVLVQEQGSRFFSSKIVDRGDGGINEALFARGSGAAPIPFQSGNPAGCLFAERRERRLGGNHQFPQEIYEDSELVRVRAVGEVAARPASFQQQGTKLRFVAKKPASPLPVPKAERIGLMPGFPVNELQFQDNVFCTAPRGQDKRDIATCEGLPDRLKIEPRQGRFEKNRKTIQPVPPSLLVCEPQEFFGYLER